MAQMSTSPGLNWFWSSQHSTSYDRAVARESQLGGGGSGTALLGGFRGMPPWKIFEIRISEIGFPDFWE